MLYQMIWMQLSPRSRQSVLFSFCWLVSDWLQVWNLFFADLFNDLLVNWSLSLVCTWFSFSNMDFFSFVLVSTAMQLEVALCLTTTPQQLEDGRTLSDCYRWQVQFATLGHRRFILKLRTWQTFFHSTSTCKISQLRNQPERDVKWYHLQ